MNYAPELIGVGRFTGELCAHLAHSAIAIDVVTTPPHYPGWEVLAPRNALRYSVESADRVRVFRCPIFLRRPMRGVWRLVAPLSFAISSAPIALWRILRTRPDVVLVVEPTLFVAPVALIAAKLAGARTILHVQDLEIDAAFAVGHMRGGIWQRLARRFESRVLRAFDRVVSISYQMCQRLEGKGVASDRLSLIRNWVDLKKIRPLNGPNNFRTELQITSKTFVALYSGSVGAKQGLGVMLTAAEHLVAEPDILFVVAGDGPAKDGLVHRYGHLPNVRFLPTQPEERFCELLNLADLHLLPQTRGAADLVLPSKLGGMLASGRPILVTADRGTELYDFLNGHAIIVPAGDHEQMANEIRRAARVPATEPQAGLADLAATFDSARSLAEFSSLLTTLCSKNDSNATASGVVRDRM
jgi:colanic acid biosynthesis glycosyl transferase WcaI